MGRKKLQKFRGSRKEMLKSMADGDKLWAEKIIELADSIGLDWQWRDGGCDFHLDGIVFKWDQKTKKTTGGK